METTNNIIIRPTVAHIDLNALSANFHNTKSFVGNDLKYMGVVKANAYGHGAVRCALRLEDEGVDWFGVAIPEEGIELRSAGVTRPILCFGSFWGGSEKLIIDYGLTPVVYDLSTAEDLNNFASAHKYTIDIHVKIDTGMGRVGIRFEDAAEFAEKLFKLTNLRTAGLLTHFASAESDSDKAFTALQISRFNDACEIFRKAGHTPDWFSMANSPGAIRHPDSRGNLVRLGGALFGLLDDILPPGSARPELVPVLSLRSRIAQVKKVLAGESLGYGRTFVAQRDSLIGLVPIGYADGYPRGLSNRGRALVNGVEVPVVGRISMDWILLDVTDVTDIAADDEIILIGDKITAGELARELGTIGYEMTCGLSKRVPRIYR